MSSLTLTTRNEFEKPAFMTIELIEGPFSRFSGRWDFDALGDVGCKISLRLVFEIDNKVMNMAFGKLFNTAADRLVDAFCERADMLYG
jgi:ribosome-associated toxin RatA of RatAB toxin-antitoxin module